MFPVRDASPDVAPAIPADKTPPVDTPARPRTDAPPVVSRSGNVSDFVQVIRDVAPVQPARPVAPPTPIVPSAPVKPREVTWHDNGFQPPKPGDFPWEEPAKPKPKPMAAPAPKEVHWSAIPSGPAVPPPLPPVDLEPMAEPKEYERPAAQSGPIPKTTLRRKRRRFGVLVVLIGFTVICLGAGGYFLFRYINDAPKRLLIAGHKEYDAGNFPQARKIFEQIVNEHPKHDLVPEARFFAELSSVRHAVAAVTAKDDPQPGLVEWDKFLQTIEDEKVGKFAHRDIRGVEIWQTGVRLMENLLEKGTAQAAANDPDGAEKSLNSALAVQKALDRFRPIGEKDPPSLEASAVVLRATVDTSRARLAKVNQIEKYKGESTDDDMERYRLEAMKIGIEKDPQVVANLAEMNRKIEARAVYVRQKDPIRPTAVPDDGLTSLLFAPRFDRALPRQLTWAPTIFFCQARGVLYALDEFDGRVRWAARTGLDTDIMPVRVPASDLNAEMVLIASNTGNQFGITARGAKDGRPLWHQALAVPCQGPPAIVGPNAYVSLGDANGTILEIELASGDIVGHITTGRALGPTIVGRPGTGLLYVPGDAQAVYVFDVYRHDPDGKRLEPVLLGVMSTRHPRGSLRGVPVFSNPDPNDPGPKFFVLGQADGLDTMKLKAFRLADGADGKPISEPESKEIPIPGWASFPPHCDGEKVAVVTDKGQFGLYGLALAGNSDENLFAFPSKPSKNNDTKPSRGQVVMAEEGMFWILAAGVLQKFRFGINQGEGVRLIPYGDPIPAGEPLQNPQTNLRGDTFVVVTQDGMTCRATAVDTRTGEVRWRRELGLMIKGDPMRIGDAIVMMDQAGGFYRVDTKPLAEKGAVAWLVDEKWLVARPASGFSAYLGMIAGPNDSAVAVLTGEAADGRPQLLIRRLVGNVLEERMFKEKPAPAGLPIVSGQFLIVPLSDGNLYRLKLGDPAAVLEQGPTWRGERLPATSVCHLVPLNDDELYATDGARSVIRWQWSSSTKLFVTQGKLRLSERPAAAMVVLPTSPPRVVLGDGQGRLTMIDGNKLTLPAVTVWRPGPKNWLPVGPIATGLHLEKAGDGSQRITYTVDGKMVWLSPDADNAEWVGPAPIKALEGRPIIDGKRVLLTDRAGVIRVIDITHGKETGDEFHLTGSHAFASAAVPVGANRVLAPLVDGTVVLGELKPRPKQEPKTEEPKAKDAK
jgi:outer membrane protein assembly factor BamB